MTNLIRGIRIMCGFTQKDIAEKLSIAEKTYCKKENNPDDFSIGEFKKLSFVLGVAPEIFFNGKVTEGVTIGGTNEHRTKDKGN